MKATLFFAAAASAAVIKRQAASDCCFGITISGAQAGFTGSAGSLGELYDGQIRVGPGYSNTTFCYNQAAGTIVDQSGRGCVEIGTPKQYQCDESKVPSAGITIDSAGVISHNGSSIWYECLVNDQGVYNIYTADTGFATECQQIKLTTTNGNCASASSSTEVSPVTASAQASTASAQVSTATASAQVSPVTASAQVSTVTAPAAAAQVSTVTVSGAGSVTTVTAQATCPASTAAQTITVTASAPAAATVTVQSSCPASGAAQTVTVTAAAASAQTVTVTAQAAAAQTVTVTSVQSCATQTQIKPTTVVSVSNAVSTEVVPTTVVSVSNAVSTKVVPTTVVSVSNAVSTEAVPTTVVSKQTVTQSTTAVVTSVAPVSSSSAVVSSSAVSTTSSAVPTTSSVVATTSSAVAATSPAVSTTSSSAASTSTTAVCPENLSGLYTYPHLIVPVSSASPNTAYGTQYFAYVNSVNSTIFNIDVESSWAGKTCDLIFTIPDKSLLETTDYNYKSQGSFAVSQLDTVATQQTTYSNMGASTNVGTFPITVGTKTVIVSGSCAAGTTQSFEFSSANGLDLTWFNDWNPCPLGVFMTAY